jgi:MFS family permease
MIAEIYPLHLRGLAMGVATIVNWASNLVVLLTVLTLTDTFGPSRTFWLYGLLTIAALIFPSKLAPETKDRTLDSTSAIMRRVVESGGELESDFGSAVMGPVAEKSGCSRVVDGAP